MRMRSRKTDKEFKRMQRTNTYSHYNSPATLIPKGYTKLAQTGGTSARRGETTLTSLSPAKGKQNAPAAGRGGSRKKGARGGRYLAAPFLWLQVQVLDALKRCAASAAPAESQSPLLLGCLLEKGGRAAATGSQNGHDKSTPWVLKLLIGCHYSASPVGDGRMRGRERANDRNGSSRKRGKSAALGRAPRRSLSAQRAGPGGSNRNLFSVKKG